MVPKMHRVCGRPTGSGITDGGGGQMPPGSSDVGPFLEMSPLNSASFAF